MSKAFGSGEDRTQASLAALECLAQAFLHRFSHSLALGHRRVQSTLSQLSSKMRWTLLLQCQAKSDSERGLSRLRSSTNPSSCLVQLSWPAWQGPWCSCWLSRRREEIYRWSRLCSLRNDQRRAAIGIVTRFLEFTSGFWAVAIFVSWMHALEKEPSLEPYTGVW